MAAYIVNAVRVAAKPITTQPFLITILHHQLLNLVQHGYQLNGLQTAKDKTN